MGVVSSFCGAYNIRYDLMRLVARSGWAWYNGRSLGRRQAVRHWVLVPAFAGSNPADPAIFCAAKCGWGGRTRRASCRPSHEVSGNGDFLMRLPAAAGLRSFPADPAIFCARKTAARSATVGREPWLESRGLVFARRESEAGVPRNLSEHGAVRKLVEVGDTGGVAEVLDDFGLRQGGAAVERNAFGRIRFFGGAVGAGGLVGGVAR